jgi:hypothetical protein
VRPRVIRSLLLLLLTLGVVLGAVEIGSADRQPIPGGQPTTDPGMSVGQDLSPPLRDLPPAPPTPPRRHVERRPYLPPSNGTGADSVRQAALGPAKAPSNTSFDGVPAEDSAPPDTNGAVGPNHYFQIVNQSFKIFNKSGGTVFGPVHTNTLWSGFGGGCQTNNDGDATVSYDRLAHRWVVTQFSVSTTPYLECVAVSKTGDPTGQYYRYAFQYSDFPDYPKLGVWPDAYYVTFDMFDASSDAYKGPTVCAYDRAKMLQGLPATQQCFKPQSPASEATMLPSDLDGATAPPAGSPNYVVDFGTNSLKVWKFKVDWATPANSRLLGPTVLPVAAFTPGTCNGSLDCIPQSNTAQKLDSLGDRVMYRFAYRRFADHESLVVNHAVKAGTPIGVRWYELRLPGGNPAVYQQGTFAPDTSYRWMGSLAMDRTGNIGLGYSVSSSAMHPSIRYTGRLVSDPLNQMTQGEGTLFNGSGSQTGGFWSAGNRWGDYSSMNVDPADDCTFWFTTEYLPANGSFNWHTRIGKFKFPNCSASTTPDFAIDASPAALTIAQGSNSTSTISTYALGDTTQSVSLTATGLPAGASATFTPNPITSGGSSSMKLTVGSSTAPGDYTITVKGTGPTSNHSTSVALKVFDPATSDFSITRTPSALTVPQGSKGTVNVSTAVIFGGAQSITLSSSGVPSGTSVSFSPSPITAGNDSTMTISVGTSTPKGTYTLTIKGTGTGANHSTTLGLKVTGPSAVKNGGFEDGSFSPWSPAGDFKPFLVSGGRNGGSAAQLGSVDPFTGKSILKQTVTVPSGSPKLTFWYQPHCLDTIDWDWIEMQIRTTGGAALKTVLHVCPASTAWTQVTVDMSPYAGQTLVLWFNDHDDGNEGDPTYFLLDDDVLS